MNRFNTARLAHSKEEYNEVPVHYCKSCLSLKIRILTDDVDYCDSCGCTTIGETSIEDWDNMYKEKYN